jgi:hypothetical protein
MKRRPLKLETLDAAIAEIDRLHAAGYERVAQWDLARTCDHLTVMMRMSLDGFPPELRFSWPARTFLAPFVRWSIIGIGWMPPRIPVPHVSMDPREPRAEQTAVSHCVATLREVRDRDEPFYASPLLGRLSPDQWRRFHLVHAQHHLTFLLPRG